MSVLNNKNSAGYTAVEAIVVFVLIGISIAYLVLVINPDLQLKKTNDFAVRHLLNKIVLPTKAFISAYGKTPNEEQFLEVLNMDVVQAKGDTCKIFGSDGPSDSECLFSVKDLDIPHECDSTGWADYKGSGKNACYFRYQGNFDGDPARFRLYVRSLGAVGSVFAYDNKEGGKVFECPMLIDDSYPLTEFCR